MKYTFVPRVILKNSPCPWTAVTKVTEPPKQEINAQEPLLDAKYEKSNLIQEVIKLTHLNSEEKDILLTVLQKPKAHSKVTGT